MKDSMYTIYHIPGIKIGCTNNLEKRVIKQQGFTTYEILEEHSNIYVASERELELQKQHGNRIDSIPYWKSVETFNQISRLGGLSHKNKPKSNEWKSKKPWKNSHIERSKVVSCPHCDKSGAKFNMTRYHFDNCKHKEA